MSKYYDSTTDSFHPIPDAPFYVVSNDTFMSGLGPAQGLVNSCVVPCESLAQAQAVERYARSRSDQKYVRIVGSKPRTKRHVLYSLVLGWLDRAKDGGAS